MQVIQPTFDKYRNVNLVNNIYDPVANIVAAINYMKARYGSVANVPGIRSLESGHGYIGY